MIANNFFTSKGNTIEKVMKTIIAAIVLTITGWINTAEAMSRAEIEAAIEAGQLGDYLFVDHLEDPGVQQFIRHSWKHFSPVRAIGADPLNKPAQNAIHTVWGNGDWGVEYRESYDTHTPILISIFNRVGKKNYKFTEDEAGGRTRLEIINLTVNDVRELYTPIGRAVLTCWEWKKGKYIRRSSQEASKDQSILNLKIVCTVVFDLKITQIKYKDPKLNPTDVADGTAGWCYVEAKLK